MQKQLNSAKQTILDFLLEDLETRLQAHECHSQLQPTPCVKGALGPIGSAVEAEFFLHGLVSPGCAELYPNLPDHRYRAVEE